VKTKETKFRSIFLVNFARKKVEVERRMIICIGSASPIKRKAVSAAWPAAKIM
jgi:hypothetical protein